LTIARSGATTAGLFWPANTDSGFALESAGTLNSPAGWTGVTNPIVITNGQRKVMIGLTNPASFYRLRKP
jgi:hypothetical protein